MAITKVSLSITSTTTNGNKKKYSLGYANPEATDAKLLQLAQKINGLTDNTFNGVEKQVVTDISNTVIPYSSSITSTSDFFSTDGATWQAFIEGIPDGLGTEGILFKTPGGLSVQTKFTETIYQQLLTADENASMLNLIQYLNGLKVGNYPTFGINNNTFSITAETTKAIEIVDGTSNNYVASDIWSKITAKTPDVTRTSETTISLANTYQ